MFMFSPYMFIVLLVSNETPIFKNFINLNYLYLLGLVSNFDRGWN